jgi:prolyl-tRNA synthetase
MLYAAGPEVIAVLVRGDQDVNEVKVKRLLGVQDLELLGPEKVQALTGAPVGFAGPIGLTGAKIIADRSIRAMWNFVVGANKIDLHYINANWERDFQVEQFGDLRNVVAGDPSPRGDGSLKIAKGIEVGHVFMLGTKYSVAMSAKFLDAQGQEQPAVMGCYGIGIGRTAAASIEQNHDAKGIVWPIPLAPFHVHLLPLSQSQSVREMAERLYKTLRDTDIEVLWDDRDERAGVKFNDADLIGAPFQLILGDKSVAQGLVELKARKTGQTSRIPPGDILPSIQQHLTPLA